MNPNIDELINPNIKDIHPYNPGRPHREQKRELGLRNSTRVSSNENNLGPSQKAVEAIADHLGEIHRYPEGNCFYLKTRLAEKLGMAAEQLIFGNGSDELIGFICRSFLNPGEEFIQAPPTFPVYGLAAQEAGGLETPVPMKDFHHDLEAMAERISSRTKLVFICTPNNPTGTIVKRDDFRRFMSAVPERVIVVIDEAYTEFTDGPDHPDFLEYIRRGRYLITMRTFSKFYGLAGLRIGYAVAHPEIIGYLNLVRMPFNVNILAQAAALGALDDEEYQRKTLELVREGKAFFYREFDRLGIKYVPTCANFILFDTRKPGREIYEKMLHDGIFGRMMGVYRLPTYLRLTFGTREENQAVIKSLVKYL
ncbi:MAG: histidinol-phosphate transaminase [bacterium]